MGSKKALVIAGLISGAIFCLNWALGHIFLTKDGEMDMSQGEALGYLAMVIALSTVYFGVKHYRDNQLSGRITFKQAFLNGLIIVLIASVIYVISWMIYYNNFIPDFADNYTAHQIEILRESGLSGVELDDQIAEMESFNEMYKQPPVMVAFTFLEVFPVGLVISLLSALVLKNE